jgi:hypothetical protein
MGVIMEYMVILSGIKFGVLGVIHIIRATMKIDFNGDLASSHAFYIWNNEGLAKLICNNAIGSTCVLSCV